MNEWINKWIFRRCTTTRRRTTTRCPSRMGTSSSTQYLSTKVGWLERSTGPTSPVCCRPTMSSRSTSKYHIFKNPAIHANFENARKYIFLYAFKKLKSIFLMSLINNFFHIFGRKSFGIPEIKLFRSYSFVRVIDGFYIVSNHYYLLRHSWSSGRVSN